MNYLLICPNCKKEEKYSTKNANDYLNTDKHVVMEWDCKHCGGLIEATSVLKLKL